MRRQLSTGIRRAAAAALSLVAVACVEPVAPPDVWTPAEQQAIASLWIGQLPPLPSSPGYPVADDPRAIAFGHRLFFDDRLSANGRVACANCHQPALQFKDGLARSRGIGLTARKSMSLLGVAYSPWLFWDGRRDSLWAQALEPLEDPIEHGGNRVDLARVIAGDTGYRSAYEALFGSLPELADRTRFPPASPAGSALEQAAWNRMTPTDQHAVSIVFANLGRALEAYQRRLQPGPAPFDAFAEALQAGDLPRANRHLDAEQRQGLRLFLGRANCIHCHNGPRFTNDAFHNTGLDTSDAGRPDRGRSDGVRQLLADPFNCMGPYSNAPKEACAELRFVRTEGDELVGAFRTVSLRSVADTGPYMHDGRFATLNEVLHHYNEARPTASNADLQPLRLTAAQMQQIVRFLESLSAPPASPAALLQPPLHPHSAVDLDGDVHHPVRGADARDRHSAALQ
jgi:cytochrome c peroxidase